MATRLEALTERLVTRIEAFLPVEALGNPRRETQERLERMPIGQTLQATVVAKLDDGKFIVDLGNTANYMRTQMALPGDTRVGQKLNLVLLSKTPQLAFQLEPEAATVVTSISTGAQMLENILVERKDVQPVLNGKVPILNTPQLPAAQIEQALRQVIETSGLSYEAHVAQWTQGTRPFALLQQEPQQRIYQKTRDAAQKTVSTLPASPPTLPQASAQTSAQTYPADLIQQPVARVFETEQSAPGRILAEAIPVDPELAQIVNAQIDTLEHKQFQWQGEIWPNQTMVWKTSKEMLESPSDDTDESAPKRTDPTDAGIWQTTITLDLPGLGQIHARIRLHDETVQIEMEGQAATSVQRLKQQGLHLSERMSSAGLGLTALTIREADTALTPGSTQPTSVQS